MKTLKNLLLLVLILKLIKSDCEILTDKKILTKITEMKKRTPNFKGSFGKVYVIGSEAWKLTNPEDLTELESLKNEVSAMEKLKNLDYVVTLNSCYKIQIYRTLMEKYYHQLPILYEYIFRMDFLKDGELYGFRYNDEFELDNLFYKFDMIYKLALGIKNIHDSGLKHLDVKLENVFMMNKYTPMVGDFGFTLPENENKDFIFGTWPYIAPESFTTKDYDKKSDIYALGIMFDEILNNIVSDQNQYTEYKITTKNKPESSKIFKNLLINMVKPDKSKRYNIDKVIEELLKLLPKIIKYIRKEDQQIIRAEDLINEYILAEENYLENQNDLVTKKAIKNGSLKKLYDRALLYYKAVGVNPEAIEPIEKPVIEHSEEFNNLSSPDFSFDNLDLTKQRNTIIERPNHRSSIMIKVDGFTDSEIFDRNVMKFEDMEELVERRGREAKLREDEKKENEHFVVDFRILL